MESIQANPSQAPKQDEPELYPEEELTEGNWKTPDVQVKDVKIVTGEEDEDVFWSNRARLYRWNDNQWKQRGSGEAKLLQNKKTKKIRFLMRQDKTLKIVANHYVLCANGFCKLALNSGSDRIWVWGVMDFSEDNVQNEQFALKFATIEQANEFKDKFNEASDINTKIYEKAKDDMNADQSQDKTETEENKKFDNKEKEQQSETSNSAKGENKESSSETTGENKESSSETTGENKESNSEPKEENKETNKEETETADTAEAGAK